MVTQSIKAEKAKLFYGYIIVSAGFVIMALSSGALYSFGVFLKPMAEEFGWARALTSGAYSLCFFMSGVWGMIMGRLNDRIGPRLLMTASGFFLGLGFLLMSRTSAAWELYLFYGVMIAIGTSTLVPVMSTVARWFIKRRGLMTGIVISGIGFGTIIMPPVARLLITDHGWRVSYIVIGSVAMVVIMVIAQFLKRDPGKIGQLPYGGSEVRPESVSVESSTSQTQGFSLQEAIRTRQLWLLFTIYICYGFFVQAILVHIAPHASDLGISAMLAANIISIIGGLSIAGRIGIGTASDRIGSKSALIIVFSLMALVLFSLQLVRDLWMFYLFAIFFGFSYGGMVACESPVTAESFGLKAHGAILGVILLGATVGGGIGPVAVGRIFDITGSYKWGFLICAIFAATGVVLASLLKRPRR